MTAALSDADLAPLRALRAAVEEALEGKPQVVELALIALLARGHLLVEDVPGVGKTTLARALSQGVGGVLRRIQFTSDLLPSDVLGVSVYDPRAGTFSLRQGPIFANVLLADEINRASPRTQSALLEAMNEGQVSLDGDTLRLPAPFFVIATQNPQDFSGTYPLPESQLDRFLLRIHVGYPPPEVELRLLLGGDAGDAARAPTREPFGDPARMVALQELVRRTRLDPSLAGYIQTIAQATRSSALLTLGVSTRGTLGLAAAARARAVLRGRAYVLADDIQELAVPVLAHRVRLASAKDGFAATREEEESALREIVARIPVPV